MTTAALITAVAAAVVFLALGAVIGYLFGSARTRSEMSTRLAQAETARQLLTDRSEALEADARLAGELTGAVGPLAAGVRRLQEDLTETERQRIEQMTRLSEQLTHLSQQNRDLRESTGRLGQVLNATSSRGAWGEVQLRRIVEYAGMLPHVDFDTQVNVTTADSALRPDMVINLPHGGTIVVDAKAPLSARLRAEDTGKSAADEHARAFLRHVDSLASKEYWKQFAASPDFVVCFVPSDSLLSEAAAAYPQLIEQAMSRNVVIASPSTLLVLLKTAAMGWRHEAISSSAEEVLQLGRELYDRVGTLAGHAARVGTALQRAVGDYNTFIGSFESRFLVTARKFTHTGLSTEQIDALPGLDAAVRKPSADELSRPDH